MFGIRLAQKLNGEIVSADSRQVYTGKNLIYGKDLPANLKPQVSNLNWRDRYLKYYEIEGVKIWLYDVVKPNESYSVALWRECAQLVIEDILSRGKLPIIVGGTGLYIKSLTHHLADISVPRNEILRKELADEDAEYLWDYLQQITPKKMNESDRKNPRRLIRAIEIAQPQKDTPLNPERSILNTLQIGLTAPKDKLIVRIKKRVRRRKLDASFAAKEINIMKKQLTWFKKQSHIYWFDISEATWSIQASQLALEWYNEADAKKG